MAQAGAFDWICGELEQRSKLDTLEARGTVRIALKQAGLDARTVTAEQLTVVAQRVLPGELVARGIEDAESICAHLLVGLKRLDLGGPAAESPEDVFRRLGG